jgi:hypothetical protein
MKRPVMWMSAFLCVAFIGIVQQTASAQQKGATTTKSQSVVHFEVVAVQGNTVTVKTREQGGGEVTVDDSYRFTVDGKPVSVHELKPGMKGTSTMTTTTTVTPVVVTEVKSGRVAKVAGNSIIVSTANGYKMFTEEDAAKRGVKIIKNGEPADFSALREGDTLSATIVTEHPPKVVTKKEVNAAMTSPATASPSAPSGGTTHAAPKAGQSSASDAGMAAATTHKKLPKTASVFPLVGAVGAVFCGLALALGVLRRRAV